MDASCRIDIVGAKSGDAGYCDQKSVSPLRMAIAHLYRELRACSSRQLEVTHTENLLTLKLLLGKNRLIHDDLLVKRD
jgi:hypothetical protein